MMDDFQSRKGTKMCERYIGPNAKIVEYSKDFPKSLENQPEWVQEFHPAYLYELLNRIPVQQGAFFFPYENKEDKIAQTLLHTYSLDIMLIGASFLVSKQIIVPAALIVNAISVCRLFNIWREPPNKTIAELLIDEGHRPPEAAKDTIISQAAER